ATGCVALNVFDFYALINNNTTVMYAEYILQKSGSLWKKVAYHILCFGLKDLHLECVHDPDGAYTIGIVCRKSSTEQYVCDEQAGIISVKNLFEAKYGVRLEYPHLPVVVVNSPDGRRDYVPMECVQVVENEKLLFVSILATRQAIAATMRAVYGRSRDATCVFKKTD
ncbi:PAZ domain-containing protein, partial [Aphelenchoides avenae]